MNIFSGKNLSKNAIYNVAGQFLPLAVGILSMPILIRGLGKERFGIFALAWTVIGYYSLFDFGISRAITKIVAERIASHRRKRSIGDFWTGSFMLLLFGIGGALVIFLCSGYLVNHVLNIPGHLIRESLWSFNLLGLSLPVILLSPGMWGFLSAFQRFDMINYLRIPLGVMNF